uniref:Uncharacterized protein n=1 Tax=Arundo donax TaxID=35708 RepID=A0A0A9H7F2_ARUDO
MSQRKGAGGVVLLCQNLSKVLHFVES